MHGGTALAHTMAVTPYDLPVPFGLYVYACAAMLVLTFGVLAVMPAASGAASPRGADIRIPRLLPIVGQAGALALLGLTITAGLCGTPSPVANIAPTLFWVGLMLCLAMLSAVLGDVFQIINPWHSLARALRLGERPRMPYPSALASWPAFACYLALTWLELMAPPRPSLLAWALIGYTVLTLAGAAVFGRAAWFGHAELFGMFFRLCGTLAPVAYRQSMTGSAGGWVARCRPLLSGTQEDMPRHVSVLLFLLFMLAGTTYDGVWQTSFGPRSTGNICWLGCIRSGATTWRAHRQSWRQAIGCISAAA